MEEGSRVVIGKHVLKIHEILILSPTPNMRLSSLGLNTRELSWNGGVYGVPGELRSSR